MIVSCSASYPFLHAPSHLGLSKHSGPSRVLLRHVLQGIKQAKIAPLFFYVWTVSIMHFRITYHIYLKKA